MSDPTPLRPEPADEDEFDRREHAALPVIDNGALTGVRIGGQFYPIAQHDIHSPNLSPDVPEFDARGYDQMLREAMQGTANTMAAAEAVRLAGNAQVRASYTGAFAGGVRSGLATFQNDLRGRRTTRHILATSYEALESIMTERTCAVAQVVTQRAQLQAYLAGRDLTALQASDDFQTMAREVEFRARINLLDKTNDHEHELKVIEAKGAIKKELKKLKLELAMAEKQADNEHESLKWTLNMIPELNHCMIQLQRAQKEHPTEQLVAAMDLLRVALEKGGELLKVGDAAEQKRMAPFVQEISKRAINEALRAMQ